MASVLVLRFVFLIKTGIHQGQGYNNGTHSSVQDIGVPVFEMGTSASPVDIARAGVAEAKRLKVDAVIVDTAGRLQVRDKSLTLAYLGGKATPRPSLQFFFCLVAKRIFVAPAVVPAV
jgi:hypothetical protein